MDRHVVSGIQLRRLQAHHLHLGARDHCTGKYGRDNRAEPIERTESLLWCAKCSYAGRQLQGLDGNELLCWRQRAVGHLGNAAALDPGG